MESFTIHAGDGQRIAARLFRPEGEVRRVVLIAPALGVTQAFYEDFARWLSTQGLATITFDYRGIGLSAPSTLKGYHASITDWAVRDVPAVIDAAADSFPGLPVSYIGHSLGGQIFGMVPNNERIDRVLTVACGSGHKTLVAKSVRPAMPLLMHVIVPLALRTAGYFPGKRLRMLGDLPRGVIMQWRRWCLHPDYVGSETGVPARYAQVRQPFTTVILSDDELISPAGVRNVHGLYANAQVQYQTLRPQDHGLRHLRHFGFFKKRSALSIWPQALGWI